MLSMCEASIIINQCVKSMSMHQKHIILQLGKIIITGLSLEAIFNVDMHDINTILTNLHACY